MQHYCGDLRPRAHRAVCVDDLSVHRRTGRHLSASILCQRRNQLAVSDCRCIHAASVCGLNNGALRLEDAGADFADEDVETPCLVGCLLTSFLARLPGGRLNCAADSPEKLSASLRSFFIHAIVITQETHEKHKSHAETKLGSKRSLKDMKHIQLKTP